MTKQKMAIIGECMLEISAGQSFPNESAKFSFGGDTLNVALYCSRLGGSADYITALGDDEFSHQMTKAWRNEGIGTTLIETIKGAVPGLYAIVNDFTGERSFLYWRDNAPVKKLFKSDFSDGLIEKIIERYDVLYFTGITLSLFDNESLDKLYGLVEKFKQKGGRIAFDLNYRPRGWNFDTERALDVIERFSSKIDIVITGLDDEKELFNDETALKIIERYKNCGASEIIIKSGSNPTIFYNGEKVQALPLEEIITPIDTTAAGDSFNGAYMAARLNELDISDAIIYGQSCSTEVIKHQGAIIPKSTTKNIEDRIERRMKEISCQAA